MRNHQNQEGVKLFGNEYVPAGYRGRRSQPAVSTATARWIAGALVVLLISFTTTATAISVGKHAPKEGQIGRTLPANVMLAPSTIGFAVALY